MHSPTLPAHKYPCVHMLHSILFDYVRPESRMKSRAGRGAEFAAQILHEQAAVMFVVEMSQDLRTSICAHL